MHADDDVRGTGRVERSGEAAQGRSPDRAVAPVAQHRLRGLVDHIYNRREEIPAVVLKSDGRRFALVEDQRTRRIAKHHARAALEQ